MKKVKADSFSMKRELKPKDYVLIALVLVLLWLAYLYLPSLWSRTSRSVREMQGDIITFHREAPNFTETLRPGGTYPTAFGSPNGGMRSKGLGGRLGSLLWKKETPLPYVSTPIVGPKERLLIHCKQNPSSVKGVQFVSYSTDGTLLWQFPLETASPSACWLENGGALLSAMTQAAYLKTTDTSNSLVMVNPEGKTVWKWNRLGMDGAYCYLHLTSAGQIILPNALKLYSFRSNGEQLWNITLPSNLASEYRVSDIHGRSFGVGYGAHNRKIYCIDAAGKILWENAEYDVVSRLVVTDEGNLCFVRRERQGSKPLYSLYCLSSDGKELWYKEALPVESDRYVGGVGIALSSNGHILVRGLRNLLCFDKKGNLIWNTDTPEPTYRSHSTQDLVVTSNGYVYITLDTLLLTLSPIGQVRDRVSVSEGIVTGMAVGEKKLYVTAWNETSNPPKGYLMAYELLPPEE